MLKKVKFIEVKSEIGAGTRGASLGVVNSIWCLIREYRKSLKFSTLKLIAYGTYDFIFDIEILVSTYSYIHIYTC